MQILYINQGEAKKVRALALLDSIKQIYKHVSAWRKMGVYMKIILEAQLMNVLKEILIRKQVPQSELLKSLGCTKKQLRYRIAKMNEFLNENGMTKLESKNCMIISHLNADEIMALSSFHQPENNAVVENLKNKDRMCMECIYLFCSNEQVSTNHFVCNFRISKNTVLNDLSEIRKRINSQAVELLYSRQKGYYFDGEAMAIRSLIFLNIARLGNVEMIVHFLAQILEEHDFLPVYEETTKQLCETAREVFLTDYVDYQEQIALMLTLIQFHSLLDTYCKRGLTAVKLQKNNVFHAAKRLGDKLPIKLPDLEMIYCTLLLLNMSHDHELVDDTVGFNQNSLNPVSEEIVDRFSFITHVRIEDKECIVKDLSNHLQSTRFRSMFGFPIINPYLKQIKKHYNDIYSVTKMLLRNMELQLGYQINDDEIGYLCMYLLTIMDIEEEPSWRFNALLIDNVSDEGRIRGKLFLLFPDMYFDIVNNPDVINRKQLENCDVIFSTVQLRETVHKPFFYITPWAVTKGSQVLKEMVYNTLSTANQVVKNNLPSADRILKLISLYCNIFDYEGLKAALEGLGPFHYKMIEDRIEIPPLKKVLKPKHIMCVEECEDWIQAIEKAAEPLIQDGSITPKYVESIIKTTKQHGPYIKVYPYIAMPHAFSQNEVKRISMSLLHLKRPVNLLDDPAYPIRIFIVVAAIDDKLHIRALSELAEILEIPEKRDKLLEAGNTNEIATILYN